MLFQQLCTNRARIEPLIQQARRCSVHARTAELERRGIRQQPGVESMSHRRGQLDTPDTKEVQEHHGRGLCEFINHVDGAKASVGRVMVNIDNAIGGRHAIFERTKTPRACAVDSHPCVNVFIQVRVLDEAFPSGDGQQRLGRQIALTVAGDSRNATLYKCHDHRRCGTNRIRIGVNMGNDADFLSVGKHILHLLNRLGHAAINRLGKLVSCLLLSLRRSGHVGAPFIDRCGRWRVLLLVAVWVGIACGLSVSGLLSQFRVARASLIEQLLKVRGDFWHRVNLKSQRRCVAHTGATTD